MKITVILKGRIDTNGQQPLQIRINEGGKRTFMPTGIKIIPYQGEGANRKPYQWDGQKIINHPQAKLFNDILNRHKLNAQVKTLNGSANKYPDAEFRAYLNKCLHRWSNEKSPATLQQFKTEGEKFLDYAGEIKLSRVTLTLLNDYKGYLLREGNDGKPYAPNTVAKSFKNLSAVIMLACDEKIIENNPFDLFGKPQFTNPEKEYLTKSQIDRIDKYSLDAEAPPQLRHVAAWFVIGCYTGLRFSDMREFNRKKHIINGRLVMTTIKTKDIIGMPVNERLQGLFERVGWEALQYSNQKYNEHLKTIDSVCAVHKKLTAHMSRHTFAMRCADAGISPEVTARLMGIKSLRTVSVYYKISNNRIDAELQKIFDKGF